MKSAINRKAVHDLCQIVGLNSDAVSALDIHVELPGVIKVKTEFFVLAPETEPEKPKTRTRAATK